MSVQTKDVAFVVGLVPDSINRVEGRQDLPERFRSPDFSAGNIVLDAVLTKVLIISATSA
jgi:hypothetical protein